MKLVVFTIVKNGMPFLPSIFFTLQSTKLDWMWIVAEGSSRNTHCTSWCQEQQPGHSEDGTMEFLDMVKNHPRVIITTEEMWDGKVEMCNACLERIGHDCVLMQMDADELWRPDNIEKVVGFFDKEPSLRAIMFPCRYFLGVNIVSTRDNSYGNNPGEWLRAWRFTPGDKFERHEPPQLRQKSIGRIMDLRWMGGEDGMFNHYAWWSENQCAYKELFYGYSGALDHWRRLQANTSFPILRLKSFLPWVDGAASADRLP